MPRAATTPPLPSPAERQRFRRTLLAWYRRHGRDLPWRHTSNPYHILVSEVMLQQTQVDRVLPKYHEWLGKYPSFEVLAEASSAEVTHTWRPLGYNIRPLRLRSIAQQAVEFHDGQLPSDHETLLSFKGIGEYTAGAIRSFAFRQRAPILDTNVARVLYRVFVARAKGVRRAFDERSTGVRRAFDERSGGARRNVPRLSTNADVKGHAIKKHLWAVSEVLLPHKHAFDFNQALMDFGAMQCPARKPACPTCPMKRWCRSAQPD